MRRRDELSPLRHGSVEYGNDVGFDSFRFRWFDNDAYDADRKKEIMEIIFTCFQRIFEGFNLFS